MPRTARRPAGLTLVELPGVIAIIGLLIGLLMPALQQAREAARRNTCASNLRQIAKGMLNFESANGHFPAVNSGDMWWQCGVPEGASSPPNIAPGSCDSSNGSEKLGAGSVPGNSGMSAFVMVLPFVDQEVLYGRFNLDERYGSATNRPAATGDRAPAPYVCPSYAGPLHGRVDGACTTGSFRTGLPCYNVVRGSYPAWPMWNANSALDRAAIGVFGLRYVDAGYCWWYPRLRPMRTRSGHILDGLSNTFILGEIRPDYSFTTVGAPSHELVHGNLWNAWTIGYVRWMTTARGLVYGPNQMLPWSADNQFYPFASTHPGGVHMARADGSVEFVDDTIDITLWRRLGTMAGGGGESQ